MTPLVTEVTRNALIKWAFRSSGQRILITGARFDYGRLTIADNAAGLVEAGMPKMEAIKAITSKPAKLLGIDRRTGAIRKGLEADIVVIGGDPLSSIEALKDIRMVVNNGKIIFNKIDRKGAEVSP